MANIKFSLIALSILLTSFCNSNEKIMIENYKINYSIKHIEDLSYPTWCRDRRIEMVCLLNGTDTVYYDTTNTHLIEEMRCVLAIGNSIINDSISNMDNFETVLSSKKFLILLSSFQNLDKFNVFINKTALCDDHKLLLNNDKLINLLLNLEYAPNTIYNRRCQVDLEK